MEKELRSDFSIEEVTYTLWPVWADYVSLAVVGVLVLVAGLWLSTASKSMGEPTVEDYFSYVRGYCENRGRRGVQNLSGEDRLEIAYWCEYKGLLSEMAVNLEAAGRLLRGTGKFEKVREAYRRLYVRHRTLLDRSASQDPQARLELAVWGSEQELFQEAMEDIQRVLALRPGHEAALRLRARLEEKIASQGRLELVE